MGSKAAATTGTVAQVNRTTIIELLRAAGPLSRADIENATGLSTATINRLTNGLIHDGILARTGQKASTGGRPPTLLRYLGAARSVAALRVQQDAVTGSLINLDDEIVARHVVAISRARHDATDATAARAFADEQVAAIDEVAQHFISRATDLGTQCTAIGVAVPGVVDALGGEVSHIPGMGEVRLPLGDLLRSRLPLPIIIENDANAMAYGEFRAVRHSDVNNMIGILVDHGVGAGIITNGELYRGVNGEAGEIGFLLTDRLSLQDVYSDYGALESKLAAARSDGLDKGKRASARRSGGYSPRQASRGPSQTDDDIIDILALAVAAMIIILDPQLVTLDGSPLRHPAVAAALRERLLGRIPHVPEIVIARDDAVLRGVAELATVKLHDFTYISH